MKTLPALAISIGLLGGIATWAALSSGFFLIWAAFIAWGAFFAFGGDIAALKDTIIGGIYGAFLAWLTGLAVINLPFAETLGLPVWAGIAVSISVVVLVLSANISIFSKIPACVFGYAATFAFLLQTPDKLDTAAMTGLDLNNALIIISASIVAGAVFGYVSAQVAGLLTAKE